MRELRTHSMRTSRRSDLAAPRSSAYARIAFYRKGEPLIETVLTELCVVYGFCLKPDDHAAMLEMPTDDLDAWTNAVFDREGLAEPFEKRLWRDVRNHVEHRLSSRTEP